MSFDIYSWIYLFYIIFFVCTSKCVDILIPYHWATCKGGKKRRSIFWYTTTTKLKRLTAIDCVQHSYSSFVPVKVRCGFKTSRNHFSSQESFCRTIFSIFDTCRKAQNYTSFWHNISRPNNMYSLVYLEDLGLSKLDNLV